MLSFRTNLALNLLELLASLSMRVCVNPKTAGVGGGRVQFDPPPCDFLKNVSSKERVKP